MDELPSNETLIMEFGNEFSQNKPIREISNMSK